ncbi:MAG TPA: class A beta-lactamase [Chthoniobacterales bacterium]
MRLLALLLGLIAFGAPRTGAEERTAEKQIAAIETRIGGRIGLAAVDTASGQRLTHRSDERFALCSTFKFLAAAAILDRVDREQENLDRFVCYGKADLLEYAPVTRKHVAEGGMTLGALCDAALTVSDNTAGNLLLKAIGGPGGLTLYARTLGDKKTRLDRMEPELNKLAPGEERDTTTPAAMLGNLRALLLGDALSATSRVRLNAWLTQNRTGQSLIRAGVPNDWKVGDKTGRSRDGALDDIAILRPPGKAPILLALYTISSKHVPQEQEAALAEVTRVVRAVLRK